MNALNNIENMMINLKDVVITGNNTEINKIENEIKHFLSENSDYSKLSYIEMLMVSRLDYLFKTVKNNYKKQMAKFEQLYEMV